MPFSCATFIRIVKEFAEAGDVTERAAPAAAFIENRMYYEDYETCLKLYQDFLNTFPQSRYAARALFSMADIYWRAENMQTAYATYQQVVKLFPDTTFAESAAYNCRFMERFILDTDLALAVPEEKPVLAPPVFAKLCGPEALHHYLALQGEAASVGELSESAGMNDRGGSMQALLDTAAAHGHALVGVEMASLQDSEQLFLAHVDEHHFVLVLESNPEGVRYIDSFGRVRHTARSTFEMRFGGMALMPQHKAGGAFSLVKRDALESVFGGEDPQFPTGTPGTCPNGDPYDPCDEDEGGDGVPPGPGDGPAPPDKCLVGDVDAGTAGGPGLRLGGGGSASSSMPGAVMGNIGAFGIGITAPEIDFTIMGRQGSQVVHQTDISVPVRGDLNLMFKRTFFNPWGLIDPDTSFHAFNDEIGECWSHNFSDYVIVSTNDDSNGAPLGVATNIKGKTRYYVSTEVVINIDSNDPEMEYGETVYAIDGIMGDPLQDPDAWRTGGALTHELGNVLYRNNKNGKTRVVYPNGSQRCFLGPVNNVGRMEKLRDRNGNEITLSYTNGRITTVSAPDDRYLAFSYNSNNVITKVELRKDGAVNPLKTIEYQYAYSSTLASYLLSKVLYPDNSSNQFYYNTSKVDNCLFISTYYDRSGKRTSFDFTYRQDSYDTQWTHAFDGVVTHYASDSVVDSTLELSRMDSNPTGPLVILQYDGTIQSGTLLARARYEGDGSGYHNTKSIYYGDPNDLNETRTMEFWYNKDNYRDLHYIRDLSGMASYGYEYNEKGKITKITRRYGQIYTIDMYFEYDATGLRVTKRIDPNGLESTYGYDGNGNITRYYHPYMGAGDITYAYDDTYGQLTSYTDPLNHTWTYAYDSRGNMTSSTTPLNKTTTYAYDDFGRLTSMTSPLNKTVSYEYEDSSCSCGGPAGKITKITDEENHITQMEYDTGGMLTKVIDALNRTTGYQYDAMHRLTAVAVPHDSTTDKMLYEYDALNRITNIINFEKEESTFVYDFYGDLTQVTDPEGSVSFVYYANGHLKQLIDGNNNTTNFYYWRDGGLKRTVNAQGERRYYWYDHMGNLTKTGAGEDGTTDPIEYRYSNTTGQLTQLHYSNENDSFNLNVYYYYDQAGQLTRLVDWGSYEGHYFYYDAEGKVTKYTDYDHTSANPKALNLTYDDAGRVITMTDYDGYATTYTYTDTGRVSTVTTPGNKTWTYNYNALGQPTTVALPNGMTTAYAYDTLNQMTKLEHKDGTTVKEGWEYALDANGNILRMGSTVANDDSAWEYAYDGRGRLLDAMQRNAAGLPKQRYSYTYDAGDNLLTKQCSPFKASPSLQDDFSDGDYTASPAWTVKNGTWSVDPTGLYLRADHTIANEIYTAQTQSEYELWFSYYFEEAAILAVPLLADANGLGGPALRIVDSGMEFNTGTPSISRTINTELGQWYDVRVRVEGDTITVWRGNQGEGLNLVLQQSGFTIPAPAQLGFMVLGDKVRIDNLRLITANSTDYNFTDDFNDGDMSGWNVGSNLSASSGAVRTLANISGYSSFSRYRPLSDGDIKFSYTLESTSTAAYPRIEVLARYYNWNNQILVRLYAHTAQILQYKDGVLTTLVSNSNGASTLDQAYDVTLHYDGNRVEVWRGEAGQSQSMILATDAATHLSGGNLYIRAAGNTMAEIDDITFSVPKPETTVYTCNNANELTSMTVGSQPAVTYTYDAWGRTQSEQQTLSGTDYTRTYTWMFGDKLKKRVSTFPGEEQQIDYLYDGLGKRRNIVVNYGQVDQAITWYRWIGSNESAQYTEGTDSSTIWDIGARTHSWYNGAEVQGANPSTGAYTYQLKDRLGTPRGHYNQTKTRIARTSYTPYGMPDMQLGGASSPIGYTGHLYDSQTGLNYAPFRYYNPQTARWMKRDPLGYINGTNLYAYVTNNPAAYNDPTGGFLLTFGIAIGIGAAVGGLAGGIRARMNNKPVAPAVGWGALVGGVSGAAGAVFAACLTPLFGGAAAAAVAESGGGILGWGTGVATALAHMDKITSAAAGLNGALWGNTADLWYEAVTTNPATGCRID